MNILITSAASDLAKGLAKSLSGVHRIRLTDVIDVQTEFEFVRSELGHDEETNKLVRGIDAIVHLAQLPPERVAAATDPENLTLDFLTRCTYNLLMAASQERVSRVVYASTLHLFDRCDEDWTVRESWRPRPTTDIFPLSRYLGEFVCREFAREGRLHVTCLRLGTLVKAEEAANQPIDTTWLEMGDAVHAFECALRTPGGRWDIYHIQSEFPNARFSIGKARKDLKFAPKFAIGR
jgi:nucleoside-diphosphate-sugar epimerase